MRIITITLLCAFTLVESKPVKKGKMQLISQDSVYPLEPFESSVKSVDLKKNKTIRKSLTLDPESVYFIDNQPTSSVSSSMINLETGTVLSNDPSSAESSGQGALSIEDAQNLLDAFDPMSMSAAPILLTEAVGELVTLDDIRKIEEDRQAKASSEKYQKDLKQAKYRVRQAMKKCEDTDKSFASSERQQEIAEDAVSFMLGMLLGSGIL